MAQYIFVPLDPTNDSVITEAATIDIPTLVDSDTGFYLSSLSDGTNSISVLSMDVDDTPTITAMRLNDDKPVIIIGTCTHPPHRPPVAP